jgi:hypothetical protein
VSENIRTYTFNVPGFIPGIAGTWPAGSWATVDEDAGTVLDYGPKPVISGSDEASEPNKSVESGQESNQTPVEPEQANQVPPALPTQQAG